MSKVCAVFTTRKGRKARHVERHQGINLDYWYYDSETGREFDVRDLPEKYIGDDRTAVCSADSQAHRRVIQRAFADNYMFKRS